LFVRVISEKIAKKNKTKCVTKRFTVCM
jgi:hypothetical protein